MNKKLPLLLLFFTIFSFSQTSDLIISEYGEGSGNNKFIEIYNGTGVIVNLANYSLTRNNAGGAWNFNTYNFTATTLADGATLVIANNSTDTPAGNEFDNFCEFNGDDGVALMLSGVIIDVVGDNLGDPGSGWDVAGTTSATANRTLIRKPTICDPNTNWVTSAGTNVTNSEWIVLSQDDITNLGSHTSTCVGCTPTHTIASFSPTSGPELSHITITGTGFTVGSTVDFNGTSAAIISQTATQIVAEAPIGVTTGAITVTESGCPIDSATDFTVLSGTCGGGSGGIPAGFTDLMFSGIYDDQTDSCHYFELLNPTTSAIDLTDYTVGLDNNFTLGSAVPITGFSGGTLGLTGTIAAESTIIIRLSSSGACTSCPTVTPDLSYINGGINDEDRLVLVKDFGTGSATAQDVWQNHTTPGIGYNVGYVFTRDFSAIAPSSTFTLSDWVSDGNEDCFGFEIVVVPAPTIDVQPLDIDNCNIMDINISASSSSGGTLDYLWKYNDGSSAGWTDVTSGAFSPGIVSGETTTDLSITGFNLDGYQFYCEVNEPSVCSVATNAIQINMKNTIWNGSAWSNGVPDITTLVEINGNYLTSSNGSFSACSIIINDTYRLTIDNNTFVEIENDTTVDGEIFVQTQGAFVQNNNASTFIVTTNGTALVNKITTPLNSIYEYTYWSSPINNLMVQDGLAFAHPWRRYWFNAANFLDEFIEINNTNTFIPGSDGIDDDGNDWTPALDTDVMTPGTGYIAMHNPIGFIVGNQYTYTFEGEFNNGIINAPILYNGANGDEDWNLIGNPYPSAINANTFLTDNGAIVGGAIYLWSQDTAANGNTSGNQGANFSQGDYAIITNGSGNTAGGDMIIPNSFVPSGQSFFIQGLANGNAVFNNDHRMADATSNSQFFKTNLIAPNRLWLNLTSDNGVFNQILVAYVNGATNQRDNTSYDAKASIYNLNAAVIYTEIENEVDRFTIQGKAPESLTMDEVIPVGFETVITTPTLYTFSIAQFEGLFLENNTVYLKDNLLSITHDLSLSNYTFTSEVGNFNSRFEIVFNINSLSTEEFESNSQNFSIVELQNDNVKFSTTSEGLTIKSVKILDGLGRAVYNFRGSENTEIYNLRNVSSSIYIAQIELSNGSIITKKALKK